MRQFSFGIIIKNFRFGNLKISETSFMKSLGTQIEIKYTVEVNNYKRSSYKFVFRPRKHGDYDQQNA